METETHHPESIKISRVHWTSVSGLAALAFVIALINLPSLGVMPTLLASGALLAVVTSWLRQHRHPFTTLKVVLTIATILSALTLIWLSAARGWYPAFYF